MSFGGGSQSSSGGRVWGGNVQQLLQQYADAGNLQQQQYGPDRVAGFNSTQQSALGMAANRATQGSPLVGAGQAELQRTLEGQYLSPDSNPYLAEYGRRVGETYKGEVGALGSRMEAAGRSGGGTHALGMDRADENLSRGLSNLYGGAYEAERGRMASGLGQVGALAEQDYRDLSALQSVGQARQGQSQRELDDMVARFQQGQNAPYDLLEQKKSIIGDPVVKAGGSSGWQFSCHVAAEYFGWFSPDWWAARNWIVELWQGDDAERFRAFYRRNSVDLALRIREDPELKEEWRGMFETFRNCGRDA